MCILCVVQKWSRRLATTLPWLVIPLIGLWSLSQLLPPALRFEVTPPRLACVFVLLVTLFWYEVLMPQLSAWRTRRSARIREKRRFQAIELQKLRKTATRRCRNCLTAYREQNPAGGRFMCSYCGHISRRPVLDIPGGVLLSCKNIEGIGNSAIVGDLVAKSGKIWNGKVWMQRQGRNGSGNGWFCGDWSENGTWSGDTFHEKSSYWVKNGTIFGSDNRCLREKSYSDVAVFGGRLLGFLVAGMRWLWRKGLRIGSSTDYASSDSEGSTASMKGDGGLAFTESKGEKAQRKTEEKRQARLEREMLEEEERKQREEVARLVEERRRLRDEKAAAERVYTKGSTRRKDRECKREKEVERKRHERTREKDRFSYTDRSNSEGEEAERRNRKETNKKRDFDKKSDNERLDLSKSYVNPSSEGKSSDNLKAHMGRGFKASMSNVGKSGASRYFDRIKGPFSSSSKALGGRALTPFFGRGVHTSGQNYGIKVSKPVIGDQVHVRSIKSSFQSPKVTSTVWDGMLPTRLRAEVIDEIYETSPKRSSGYSSSSEMQLNEYATGRLSMDGYGKSFTVSSQPCAETSSAMCMTAPRNSWQDLVAMSGDNSMVPTAKLDLQLNPKHIQVEGGTCHSHEHASPTYPLHSPHSEFSSPLAVPTIPSSSMDGCSMPMSMGVFGNSYCSAVDHFSDNTMKNTEIFDDQDYVTDPVSLLGPISESLDNFSLDIGAVPERSFTPKKLSTLGDVVWPSPIECPVPKLSSQGCASEANSCSGQIPGASKSCNGNSNLYEQGTWRMWDTPPIVQEGLGIGSPAWLLPTFNGTPLNRGILDPLSSAPRVSLSQFTAEDRLISRSHTPDSFCASYGPKCGIYESLGAGLVGEGPWQQKVLFDPLSDLNKYIIPDTAMKPAGGQELSSVSCWPRNDWAVHHHMGHCIGQAPQTRVQTGCPFSSPDVQSLWSYK